MSSSSAADDDRSGEDFSDEIDDNENEETRIRKITRRHYASTAAICFCSFTHSWLLVSVFPYSGFLVIRLIPGTNEENAGSYAGLLAASFMIGRAITSYGWGKIADVYGRRIVYFIGLSLSSFFSCLFGLSSSFGLALLWRFLLGASNGVAGVNKTVVSETAKGIEKLETRGMALSMGMWAWGFLLSPALSGFLSDPIKQYPDAELWISHPSLYKLLLAFPFFLPNLVSMILCLVDILAVVLLVPETLPESDRRSSTHIPRDCFGWLTSLGGIRKQSNGIEQEYRTVPMEPNLDDENLEEDDLEPESAIELTEPHLSNSETVTFRNSHEKSPPEQATLKNLWSNADTRNHLMVFWMVSFVGIAIDEAVPLFCISKEGGLGLQEQEIGRILSASGLFFALSQYFVYSWIVDRYGIHRSIQIGLLFSAPLVSFVPVALLLQNHDTDSLNRAPFWYLSLLLSWIRIFGLVFFSSITIAANRTVIPSHRGTMNGLSMLGGSIAKGLGPIVAGWMMSFGISSGWLKPRIGAAMVFVTIGGFAIAVALITVCLLGSEDPKTQMSRTQIQVDDDVTHSTFLTEDEEGTIHSSKSRTIETIA